MKTTHIHFLVLLACCVPAINKAQEEKLVFSYDSHGNLIERKLQVFPLFRLTNPDQSADSTVIPSPQPLSIYPNPANDKLVVEGLLPEEVKRAEVTLINPAGQVMLRDYYYGEAKTIPVSDLGNGIYILSFKYSQKENYAYKIVVAH